IGNIIGSNIFNIFWILGLSALAKPLLFNDSLNIDIYVMFIATIVLFLFMFVGKKNILQRWQGIVMIGLYVAYIVYLVLRG
ncbi:sodium:calcium antiporter, partial [bacterium]|nr:sodium:calcium antiporter [bacterium]